MRSFESRFFVTTVVVLAASTLARAPAASAETLTLACQEDVFEGGRPAGTAEQTIVVTLGGAETVEVRAPYGTIKLPARTTKNAVAIAVRAAGAAEARMPAKRDVDACLAKRRAAHPEEGDEVNASIAQGCRLNATQTPEPVKVDVSVDLTILDSDVVAVIERGYADDAPAADERYAVPSRPQCTVQSRK